MVTEHRRGYRIVAAGAAVATAAVMLAGCAGSSGPVASGSGSFSFLGLTSNETPANTLKALETVCPAAQKDAPLAADAIAQDSIDQKIQLLAGQDALPSAMIAPNAPALAAQLIKSGKLVDISAELKKDGLADAILPAAASTIKALYGGDAIYALPNEFNIEGIWYNKKIFADNGIQIPSTWDALVAVTEKLKAAHIQPITADGKDGWPVTRWVGAYLYRDIGPDALQKVADGTAKLTDPEYVKAADAVSALGKAGAFGANVASNDYNGTFNDFLTGKAAMLYMGSWGLSNFNDPAQNKIGVDNIGFIPFPAVTGGAGNIGQVPSNVGQPIIMSKKAFDSGAAQWLKCIGANYGDTVLDKSGVISGFALSKPHTLPPLTQLVQDQITNATGSVLWFEALFSSKATTASQTNGGLLGNGSLSGADFMQKVQSAL